MRAKWKASSTLVLIVLACIVGVAPASAGVPRFVSGASWGIPPGWNVTWPGSTLLYFTDAGPLAPNVSHAQADTMVAAAAAVWNAPTSRISLALGGQLQEDVSAGNTSFSNGVATFPQDVQTGSEAAVPVAIVYDATGEIVDLLLGVGASAPDGCRENAVIGDIDDIHQNDGSLRHATLILNGRCVGSAPEQMLQMQYQLTRAFGRVLGLSWSQTNDNVFTGQSTITANQMAYWPVMHPLDVVCGPYTYQCMSNPFTLRPEDLNTLTLLYPIPLSDVPNGKQGSNDDALTLWGILYFPNGQGMGWTNVTVRRLNNNVTEDWQTVSAVSGYDYLQSTATPLSPQLPTATGSSSLGLDGLFQYRRIPTNGVSDLYFTSEPINPLYIGDAAIGPYVHPPITPSGVPVSFTDFSAFSYGDNQVSAFMTSDQATASCSSVGSGTETTPATPDGSGWQSGQLCTWGSTAWWTASIAARHSWTLEVTATDETGAATTNKMQPVLGAWNSGDASGTLPTVGSQSYPMNSFSLGTTQLRMSAPGTTQSLRLSLSDQFGVGRPDFTYVARFLYLASVTPTVIPAGGGQLTLTGTGFRTGMNVLVNNAPATVVGVTPTQIVVNAPSLSATGASLNQGLDIFLVDPQTGGSTGITRVVRYLQTPGQLSVVSAPVTLKTSVPSADPIVLRAVAADGLTPVAGSTIMLSVTSGSAQLNGCGNPCTAVTDASGRVQIAITGLAAGPVTITASQAGGTSLVLEALDVDPVRSLAFNLPDSYIAQGASLVWQLQANLLQDNLAAASVPVTWSASPGLSLQGAQSTSNDGGTASMTVSSLPGAVAGPQLVKACAWGTICVSWQVTVVPASQWRLAQALPQGTASLAAASPIQQAVLSVIDLENHPLQGAPVYVYQRVLALAPPCPAQDRCPAAAMLAASQIILTSDGGGQVRFLPLQVPDVPQTLQVAAAAGTDSFITWSATLTDSPH